MRHGSVSDEDHHRKKRTGHVGVTSDRGSRYGIQERDRGIKRESTHRRKEEGSRTSRVNRVDQHHDGEMRIKHSQTEIERRSRHPRRAQSSSTKSSESDKPPRQVRGRNLKTKRSRSSSEEGKYRLCRPSVRHERPEGSKNGKEDKGRSGIQLEKTESKSKGMINGDVEEDSDPLENLVGPLPPPPPPKVKVRGRGAISSMGMDARFSSNYDPSADVVLNAMEDDEWGQALEALQAQAKFRQNQRERLLAAGFKEKEIDAWSKGGEKNEDDVRWAKQGEGREWDRGKVVDEAGSVDLEPSWGRLKGT